MSETYGTTGTQHDDETRELGNVEPTAGAETVAISSTGSSGLTGTSTIGTGSTSGSSTFSDTASSGSTSSDTKEVAKEEARATGAQAKEGARHVAEVGKEEAKNVAQETSQQAKELWQQTRHQLMDQSAQQQTRVADGLRSLSQELSSMARSSDQQGVASDLAQQASQRMGDVASWLDQRDPGSLVSEVKQFARQRPGTFLAAAAVIGLVGGRLSRGLVADHQEQSDASSQLAGGTPVPVDHSTAGYSAYGSPSGTAATAGSYPVTDTLTEGGVHSGTTPLGGSETGTGAGEFPR